MIERVRLLLERLELDESGTSITEFVITLPLFVMSFIAILNLYAISDFALQGKATAYTRALDDYKAVQTDWIPLDWVVNPVSAAAEAGYWHAQVSPRPMDLVADEVLDAGGIAFGHMGESWSRLLISGPPDWTAKTVGLDPDKSHMTMSSLVTTVSKSPVTGNTRYGQDMGGANSVFAKELLNDMVNISSLQGRKSWMGFMNGLLSASGSRPAFSAGMRYGVTTEGEYDETRRFLRNWPMQVQTSTHIAVPPRPTEKWITIALIRAYLASDDAYNESILAFQMDVNTSDPSAQSAQDCASNLDSISITSPGSLSSAVSTLSSVRGGNPCGSGGGAGSSNPLGFLTGPLSNAASFFGGSVPTSTSSGRVNSNSPF